MTGTAGTAGDAKAASTANAADTRVNATKAAGAVKTTNVRDGAALALGLVIVVIGSTMPSGLYAIYQRDWGAEHR